MALAAFTGAPPTQDAEPAVRRKSGIALVLLLPGVAYLVLFFLTPLVSLIITSFQTPVPDGDIGQYQAAFQWTNYTDAISEYWPQIIRSFAYALIATAAALVISYPLAYFIGVKMRGRPLVQNLLMTLVIAPFFISFLLRTLAWKSILSDDGVVASALRAISVLPPDAHITGTPFSVIFGLTYNFIPFMTLPLYATLERLDVRLLEAGQDLYANAWTTFRKVTVPLSLPGIVSGTLLTFIPAAGDYINASQDFLGAADTSMMGNVIESNFLVLQNYPAAAAMSVILMAVILLIVGLYVRRSGTEDLL
ncbi:ABC transporter permease [Leifsonia sp. NPDC058194]|uniref:ABC transporter permease n=1 Tax=Leifsonia sp. NPDC058194 TaxID=3346374 RepID=UPI0036DE6773